MNFNSYALRIVLASNGELADDSYYTALREQVIAEHLSRRKMGELVELGIYEFYAHGGRFFHPDGSEVALPHLEYIFDADCRFISNLTEVVDDGVTPKRRCRPTKSLVWLDAYFRIKALAAKRFGSQE